MDVVPLTQLDDAQFASVLAVQQRAETALDPAVPPITGPELARYARDDRSEGNRHERFAVLDGDEARALVHVECEMDVANRHLVNIEIHGAGFDHEAARVGLAAALDLAAADGRTVVNAWGPDTDAEQTFWTDLGATLGMRERISALDLTAVDGEKMDAWIADGQRRAADVEVVRWVDRCPDEYVTPWVESLMAMNDMPTEGLDINGWTVDAEQVRQAEDAMRTLGIRVMCMLAVTADGRAAGHTRVHVNPTRPPASYQWDTAVVDRERGRGIGKWVKAAMWRWLRDDEPDVTRLITGNAQSNDAMLGINVAMGYEPYYEFGAWQAPVDELRRRLD